MRFFLDTEFDGYKGNLISMALVPLNDKLPEFYVAISPMTVSDPWVYENVLHVISATKAVPQWLPGVNWLPGALSRYFESIEAEIGKVSYFDFIADWPDDTARLANAMMSGPGTMIETPSDIIFRVARVDAYPTTLEGAIQHNALWDDRALRHLLIGG
jgi:hypothetical protein